MAVAIGVSRPGDSSEDRPFAATARDSSKSISTNIYSTWTVTIKNIQVDKLLTGTGIFCASYDISG